MAPSTPASPAEKATMSTRPKPIRPSEMAASITTSADGQGRSPPDTPSAKRPREPALGLPVVEGEVLRLVAHDAGEELGQDGVAGDVREALVADQRGELVDGAPGHVHADEVGPEHGDHGGRARLRPLEQVLARTGSRRDRMPGGREEAGERAAVEGLLVEPAGEEGHLGAVHGAR